MDLIDRLGYAGHIQQCRQCIDTEIQSVLDVPSSMPILALHSPPEVSKIDETV